MMLAAVADVVGAASAPAAAADAARRWPCGAAAPAAAAAGAVLPLAVPVGSRSRKAKIIIKSYTSVQLQLLRCCRLRSL
jgi:hypothetical protein